MKNIHTTALDNPVPKGKERVMRVRNELWRRVERTLQQIEEECASSVNLLASIRREASFSRKDHRKTYWGMYGAIQGNAGKHVDALAGIVYGYLEAIELLDEALGDPSINTRRQQSGQGQGASRNQASGEAEEQAALEAEGQGEEPSSEHDRKARRATERVEEALERLRADGAGSQRTSRKPRSGGGKRKRSDA